jgi:uncharacterized protein YceK
MKGIILTTIILATLSACSTKVKQKASACTGQVAAEQSKEKKQTTEEGHLYNLPLKGMVYWIRQQLHR